MSGFEIFLAIIIAIMLSVASLLILLALIACLWISINEFLDALKSKKNKRSL